MEREASPSQKNAPDGSMPPSVSRERSKSISEDEPPTKKSKDAITSDGGDSPSLEILVTPDIPLPYLRDEVKGSESSITGSSETEDSQSRDGDSSRTK